MIDKGMVQELKTLPTGAVILLSVALISASLVISSALLSFGLLSAASIAGMVAIALLRPTEQPKPRQITTVANKPKVIVNGKFRGL